VLTHYYSDVQINKYKDIQVVKENQVMEKGWIPAILPESAYEIVETHNIDTNELFGSFKYKQNDEEKLMEDLTIVQDMNQTYTWGNFLFKVDKKLKRVKYRNKPAS
jgi:ABC-type transport system involved in Fe-S cluster assembly fused permease/ATPase subunit